MILEKDHELVERLLESAEAGKTDWVPTAKANEFTASFKGRFAVTVGASNDEEYAWLTITDTDGTILHRLNTEVNSGVSRLFELARRKALRVDEAITAILGELSEEPKAGPEISDEDIPF